MAKKLFVGNLSWDTTDKSLTDFFATVGSVASAQVITDKYTGRGRGFGFVEMATDEEAEKAIKELNGKTLDGRAINVNQAREREDRNSPGSGDRGNFSRDRNQGSKPRNRY